MKKSEHHPVIEAAGGLVWRYEQGQSEIILIHRARYNDWALPKGRRKKGETWQATACREVAEETGITPKLENYAGAVGYTLPDGDPKVVLFWNMTIDRADNFIPKEEVDAIAWVSPVDALRMMSYPDEKELLRQNRATR